MPEKRLPIVPTNSGKREAASRAGIAKTGSKLRSNYEGREAPHSGDTESSESRGETFQRLVFARLNVRTPAGARLVSYRELA